MFTFIPRNTVKILLKFSAGGRGNSSSIGPAESAQDNLDPKTRGFNLGFFGIKNVREYITESPSPDVNTSPTTPKSSPIIKVSSTSRHTGRNFCVRESTYYTRLWTAWVRGPKEFWKRSRGTSKRSTIKKKRLNGRTMETMREMDVLCPWCEGWVETIIDPNGGPLVRAAHLLKGTKGKKVQLCFGSSTRVES